MLKEFKKFAMRGNVVDMAVGIVIGTAFGKIITSLVSDIIMPPVGKLMGNVDFSSLVYVLQEKTEEVEQVSINYGVFINSILDFLIISFAIFLVISQMNKLQKKKEEAPTEKECLKCFSKISVKATRCAFCTSDL